MPGDVEDNEYQRYAAATNLTLNLNAYYQIYEEVQTSLEKGTEKTGRWKVNIWGSAENSLGANPSYNGNIKFTIDGIELDAYSIDFLSKTDAKNFVYNTDAGAQTFSNTFVLPYQRKIREIKVFIEATACFNQGGMGACAVDHMIWQTPCWVNVSFTIYKKP